MGVQGLWELLAPVGRRVSVETLAGKKLAIDASIWMIQFMKAMRDEKGEMVRNAHILGFFRRICKLLYLRTKPVFVFDGGTPALKRRTVIARRRQRDNAQAKIRKTAEKLLLNQLKAMRLKELAADLEKQRKENDIKGKMPIVEESGNEQDLPKENNDASRYNQEELDAMLAASIAAEEDEGFGIGASTSGDAIPNNEVVEEDDEEDEEMILPDMHGKVDPAVLAALPPSMQLDLLVQMRERLMAENRQKYQKVKKAPARFSELQIEAYLKTVAFRREIDGVQKAATGRGIGGMQTSRIASEANREFIFSSSFTGDKEVLTSVGQERNTVDESQAPPVSYSANAVNKVHGPKGNGPACGQTVAETGKAFHDDVETYVDDRGRLRISRLRALGIRMTRDLQRNLDLMKEIDQEKAENHQKKNNDSATARSPADVLDNASGRIQHLEDYNMNNDGMNNEVDKTDEPVFVNGAPIEISFEDITEHDEHGDDDDDKLFACLVAGDPVMDFPVDNSAMSKESLPSASDNEWEEGVIEGKSTEFLRKGCMTDDAQVEWEEGFQDIQLNSSSCPDKSEKHTTKGALEEEAAFQEAIRRSLEDSSGSMNDFHENHAPERARETVSDDEEVEWEEGFQETQMKLSCPDESQKLVPKESLEEEAAFQEAFHGETVGEKSACVSVCEGKERPDVETLENDARQQFGSMSNLDTNCSEAISAAFIELNPDKSNLEVKLLNQDADQSGALAGEILVPSDAPLGEKGLYMGKSQPSDIFSEDGDGVAIHKLGSSHSEKVAHNSTTSAYSSSIADPLHDKLLVSGCADAQNMFQAQLGDHSCDSAKLGKTSPDVSVTDADGSENMFQAELGDNSCDTAKLGKTSPDNSVTDLDGSEHFAKDKIDGNVSRAMDDITRNENKEQDIMEDDLEEVMMFLDKEREELGSEQQKLERNADSVNNEMFVECQELLQMFGLPYIIAPMEAEAQCAFLELSNQVDGVVTDDSDAFLFGAQSVYKNIFDDRKYVETYLMKDIENELGLDREKLIHMALLLGSDYTEGISGIGIVNAIEVVNAFPGRDGLREFREWIESPDPSILGKLDVGGNSRKKGSKGSENILTDSNSNVEGTFCDQKVPQPVDEGERKRQIFQDKHRNVSKNWHIGSSFPSDAVISAYASPQVDKSTEPFSWGKPDLFVLRKLCWEKFGWGALKSDELLLPVLKEYNKHETQLRLEAFYTFNERFAKIRSKRIEKAVKGITGSKSSGLMKDTPQQSRSRRKRKAKPCDDAGHQIDSTGLDGGGSSDQNNTMAKPIVKESKSRRTKEKNPQRNLEQSTYVDGDVITRKDSHVKGRSRGRGRGQQSGRGKRKNSSNYADTEIKDDHTRCSENEDDMQHILEEAHPVRRSERKRKTVKHIVCDESDNSENEYVPFFQECLMSKESLVDQEVECTDKSNGNPLNGGSDIGTGDKLWLDETGQSSHSTDKTSTTMISDPQIDDRSNQREASEDYLQFGGGFCLDEDNANESSPTGETGPEKTGVHDVVVEENHDIDPSAVGPEPSNTNADLSDDIQEYSGNSSTKFLRAMPNLRRKKRKT